jgi:hypothetical protein
MTFTIFTGASGAASSVTSGNLPVTGQDLLLYGAVGAVILATGLALRALKAR